MVFVTLIESQEAEITQPFLGQPLRYETLVRQPEAELRRIAAFLGVAYSPAFLEFHTTAIARNRGAPRRAGSGLSRLAGVEGAVRHQAPLYVKPSGALT